MILLSIFSILYLFYFAIFPIQFNILNILFYLLHFYFSDKAKCCERILMPPTTDSNIIFNGKNRSICQIAKDTTGNRIVILPDILFKNKQRIDWNAVEIYLQKYIGEIVTIAETNDIIYIGNDFPDEYKGSEYTRHLKGANAKAKANAAQGILEMLKIASEKRFNENRKSKHSSSARNGWYYFTTRFAMPIYNNDSKKQLYNIFSARLLINCTKSGKMYLYDLVNIKKEASTPLKTLDETSGKKPLLFE